MAEKNHKIGEPIEIVYQAPNAVSGLDIRADIYDENKALYSADNPLTEVDGTGTYRDSFTPDAAGEWQAVVYKFIDSNTRDGQVTKRYSVGDHNVHSVGAAIADVDADVAIVDSNVDAVKAKTDNLPAVPASEGNVNSVGGAVVTVEGKVDGVQGTANDIETKVDDINTKVSSLDTPPMVS